TARAEEVDTVVGLDAGADDYVTKPFRLAELLARARALLRRGPSESTENGPVVRMESEARRAWFGDTELQLAPKEFDLLALLVKEEGKVVSRDQSMKEVWGSRWMSSSKTLDMHISVLRRKLGDDATAPRFITTVRGVGVRFDAPPTTAGGNAVRSALLCVTMLAVGWVLAVRVVPVAVLRIAALTLPDPELARILDPLRGSRGAVLVIAVAVLQVVLAVLLARFIAL